MFLCGARNLVIGPLSRWVFVSCGKARENWMAALCLGPARRTWRHHPSLPPEAAFIIPQIRHSGPCGPSAARATLASFMGCVIRPAGRSAGPWNNGRRILERRKIFQIDFVKPLKRGLSERLGLDPLDLHNTCYEHVFSGLFQCSFERRIGNIYVHIYCIYIHEGIFLSHE